MMPRLALLLCALLLCPVWAQATEFFVSKAGNNGNTCTQAQTLATAKLTIAAGLGCLSAGDTLTIKAGTYVERFNNTIPSGTSGSVITIQGATGETVIIGGAVAGHVVLTNGTQYVTIRNLTIEGAGNTGTVARCLKIDGTSRDLTFDNLIMRNSRGTCVDIGKETARVVVKNSTVHDCGTSEFDHCFYTHGTDTVIENNHIFNSTGNGIQHFSADQHPITRGIIRRNIIHDTGLVPGDGGGMFIGNSNNGLQITNNVIYKADFGIKTACPTCIIYNNTIADLLNRPNSTDSRGILNTVGQPLAGGAATLCKNNILWQVKTSPAPPAGNFTTNPLFMNAAGGDYRLQASSTAINTAATLTQVTHDADCVARPVGAAYDYGAYERGGTPDLACTGGTVEPPPPIDEGSGADPIADIRVDTATPTRLNFTLNADFLGLGTCDFTKATNFDATITGNDLAPTSVTVTGNFTGFLTFAIPFVFGDTTITGDFAAAFCTNVHSVTTEAAAAVAVTNNLPDDQDITTGLVAHCALDETSGTTVECGTNDGTLTNADGSTQWVSGQVNNAIHLDGTNDHIVLDNESAFDSASTFTLAAWFKADTLTKNWQAIVTKGDNAYRLHRNSGTNKISCGTTHAGPTHHDLVSTTAIDDGNFHHAACTLESGTKQLFVNGNLEASATGLGNILMNNFQVAIGENLHQTGRHWDGIIDEVRFYNVALTPSQVATLFLVTGAGPPAAQTFVRQTYSRLTRWAGPMNSRQSDWLAGEGLPGQLVPDGVGCARVKYKATGGDGVASNFPLYLSVDGGADTLLPDTNDGNDFWFVATVPMLAGSIDESAMTEQLPSDLDNNRFFGHREGTTTPSLTLLKDEEVEEVVCIQAAADVAPGTTAAIKAYKAPGVPFDAYDIRGVPTWQIKGGPHGLGGK